MAEDRATKPTPETNGELKTWKRRGLLAAAWAAVAAIVAKQTTAPLEAGADGDVVLGNANTEVSATSITNTQPNDVALRLFSSAGTNGVGLLSTCNGYGVIAYSVGAGIASGAGVYGESQRTDGFGVWGRGAFSIGVLGQTSTGSAGVRGEVPTGTTANSIGVYGANLSTYTGSTPGAGGFGVYGLSANGHGLVGATAAAGAGAMVGATNGVAGAYAGLFYGPVIVSGAFTVLGAKSAAVPHPDGSHRLLYCTESPESWFEDVGKGRLECGHAAVTIDPDFAALADMNDYHVFVTVYDQPSDLTVGDRTSRGFRIQSKDTTASGEFSWRVMAKRKDIVGERLARITIPPEPQLPTEAPRHEAAVPPMIRSGIDGR